jgi:thiamine monophosphate kinase
VEANRLPISTALHDIFPGRAAGLALSGGEDYELVLIGSRPVIESLLGRTDTPLTEIGEVVPSGSPHVSVVDEMGMEIPLGRAGWDHFAE